MLNTIGSIWSLPSASAGEQAAMTPGPLWAVLRAAAVPVAIWARGGVIIAWHEALEGIRCAEGGSAMSDGDKRRPQGRGLLDDGGLVDTSRMAAGVVLRRRLNGLLRRQARLTSGLSATGLSPRARQQLCAQLRHLDQSVQMARALVARLR
jgi:hypothetical protein